MMKDKIAIIGGNHLPAEHIVHIANTVADVSERGVIVVHEPSQFAKSPIPIRAFEIRTLKDPSMPLTRNQRRRLKRLGKI